MAQKFIIDQNLGAFCIPYKLSSTSTVPVSGRISLYNSLKVASVTRVDINKSDLSQNDLSNYLNTSSKGTITLYSKEFPTSYAIFSYTSIVENPNYITFNLIPGAIAKSENIPFSELMPRISKFKFRKKP